MALDFSQKQLLEIKKIRRHRSNRLQVYAVLTGFLSLFVSLLTLIVRLLKP